MFNDGETGVYIRPEIGNHILIGGEEPACDSSNGSIPTTTTAT